MKRAWDVFCSVVDNYGDIGICWRLARQLAQELGQEVRLWVDDLATFRCLCPGVDPALEAQRVNGIEIRRWPGEFPSGVTPADIVIEAFGVRLPDAFERAIAARQPQPVWINLEYLSAESWVEGCHGLPSAHPTLPVTKYFFFPGYTEKTGGVLFERELTPARIAFQRDPLQRSAFRQTLGIALPDGALTLSLFCYENAALASLVDAWSQGETPIVCLVPEGRARVQLSRITGAPLEPGSRIERGKLMIHAIPFLELDAYDRLLWSCDFNFARGEDTWVRAQLAGRPLLWQAYIQNDDAQYSKIAAFVERYSASLEPAARSAFAAASDAWNRGAPDMGQRWSELLRHRTVLDAHAEAWARQLAGGKSLVTRLAQFCESRLK
jgi:uncharacterized repeat protein (TIGR03837 family)